MIDARFTDAQVLALTLYGMCRSTRSQQRTLEEGIACGCLIRNRVLLGSSYRDVCETFPCWSKSSDADNYQQVQHLVTQLLAGPVADPKYIEAAWIATGILNGYCRDVVHGATDAHPVAELPRPEWAQHRIPHKTYARQVFYLPDGSAA